MTRWIPALAVALAAALAAGAAAVVPASDAAAQEKGAVREDRLLYLEGGKPADRPGRIESTDYDKVVFTPRGSKKIDVPAADVTRILWGDAPATYDDAMRALTAGDFAAARKGFADAIQEKAALTTIRNWVDEFANAGLGRAYLGLGDADKAAEAFGLARSANAKSMQLDRILGGLAEAELLRGKGDAATRAADDLIAAAKSAKRSDWELEAHLLKAKARLQANDFTGAATAFDDAGRFAENAANVERNDAAKRRLQRAGIEAAVRKGWALVAKAEASKSSADFDAARQYFDGLASKHTGVPLVLASASNATGVAKLAGGDAKSALRAFMATEVVHFAARDEVARALWYQAECWGKLGNPQGRADRLKDLKDRFPGSEWARRAQ